MLCIGAAIMIADLTSRIRNHKSRRLLSYGTVVSIGAVGLVTSVILFSTNVNSGFFELYAFVNENLPNFPEENTDNSKQNYQSTTLMGSNWMQTFSWIPKYVFDKEHDFKTFLREKNLPIHDGERVMLLVDNKDLKLFILSENSPKTYKQRELYDNTQLLAIFHKKPLPDYPLLSALGSENPSLEKVEVRTNYLHKIQDNG
jgi:hypothetical protein